jgi:hypothetical protein
MQLTEIAYRIGRSETTASSAHARIDEIRADVREVVMILIRERKNGHGRKLPWMQIAAMATVALTSLLGIITPDKAAAILKSLIH